MADPSPLELWLVRHGQTTRSRDHRLAGRADVHLTAQGRGEAEALRPLLAGQRFDGVWCSDLARARVTARLAWGPAHPDPRLRELDFGLLEGASTRRMDPDVHAAIHRFDGFAAPGGESVEELRLRVAEFVAELPAGRHLVIAHGAVIRTITAPLGLDRFLRTGSLVVVDVPARAILALHERSQ